MADAIKVGVTAVASPLEVGAGEAAGLLDRLAEALARATPGPVELRVAAPITDAAAAVAAGREFYAERIDALCVVAASWFEDFLVLDLLEECAVPVIAWARPGMETGSLCGMQQLGFMLTNLGHPWLFLFDDVTAPGAHARAGHFLQAAALRRALRHARIGYLGHRVEGMTETTAHELALKRIFGPRVVGIDSQLFLERAARVEPEPLASEWQALGQRVGRVTATVQAGLEALQVNRALRAYVQELGLSAVAVGCYPHLMGKVCLSGSLLGEQGVPMACEGDVNGALGMLMLTRLSGEPVHNTDLLDPIPTENSIVFSHCGSGGFCLAADPSQITLGPVRLMNRGVCAQFPARPGPVTLLNIVPSMGGYRMATLFGQAIATDMIFPGNPLRVQFNTGYRAILGWIAGEGLGHHWMGAYGDWRVPLADLAAMVGCPLVALE